jgi:nucleoside 2-deoxyribosyltransferase
MAGAISYYYNTYYYNRDRIEKARNWRRELGDQLRKLGINAFDPTVNFESNINYPDDATVMQNLYYLNKSDIVVVNTEHLLESPGTIFELTNFYLKQKPVFAFGTDTECLKSPHIKKSISVYCIHVEEVAKMIGDLFHLHNGGGAA